MSYAMFQLAYFMDIMEAFIPDYYTYLVICTWSAGVKQYLKNKNQSEKVHFTLPPLDVNSHKRRVFWIINNKPIFIIAVNTDEKQNLHDIIFWPPNDIIYDKVLLAAPCS